MGRLDAAHRAPPTRPSSSAARARTRSASTPSTMRAEVHLARGNRVAALADLNAALAMLERIRARLVPTDFFRQNFGRSQSSGSTASTIEMQIADGNVREALETAELARSRAFVDLLAGRDVAMLEGARSAPAATVADLDPRRDAARLDAGDVLGYADAAVHLDRVAGRRRALRHRCSPRVEARRAGALHGAGDRHWTRADDRARSGLAAQRSSRLRKPTRRSGTSLYDVLHRAQFAIRCRGHRARSSPSCRTARCRCCRLPRCRTTEIAT